MYRTLLVPLDGSALGEGALPTAAYLAQRMGAGVTLVRAASDASPHTVHEARHYLDGARTLLPDNIPVHATVSHGPAAHGILDALRDPGADFVVMTTHGRGGLRRLVYGSVAEQVLAASPAPVWLVPARGTAHPALLSSGNIQILALFDGSLFAEAALFHAVTLARALAGRLILLRVVPPQPLLVDPIMAETLTPIAGDSEEAAEGYLQKLASTITLDNTRVRAVVRTGPPAQTILDEMWASGADVLVMATHGRSGLTRTLLGSVAMALVHACTTPMVLIRPGHTASPATGEMTLVD